MLMVRPILSANTAMSNGNVENPKLAVVKEKANKKAEINEALRAFLDEAIVPILVRAYLASEICNVAELPIREVSR